MFDMGFTEMMLIGIVALVVIGPERLPGVARTAGKYVGRLKRFMTTVKADVEQELRADELRQILSEQQKELNSLKDTISEAGREIKKDANVEDAVNSGSAVTAAPADETASPETASEVTTAARSADTVSEGVAATEPSVGEAAPATDPGVDEAPSKGRS
jgi:sec-independent protein translocase protein TatB